MLRLILRGLWARKLRTILTSLAILLGVAMISGTFVLTDQIDRAFGDIFQEANKGTDAVIFHDVAFTANGVSTGGPLPESLVGSVKNVPGVQNAEGQVEASGSLVVDGKLKDGT